MRSDDLLSTYAYYLSVVSAGYIMDRYKTIKSLKFKLQFENPSGQSEPYIHEFTRGPEDSALFFFRCPLGDCLDGGHNLSKEITAMLKDERHFCRGESKCQGYKYEGNAKKPCEGRLLYEVKAEYYNRKEKNLLQILLGA
jgi:hypothetical protein